MRLLTHTNAKINSRYEKFLTETATCNEQRTLTDMFFAGEPNRPTSQDVRANIDYSEEAIPERDPGYRPPDRTLDDALTIETMPAEARRALARCLEQLGMKPAKAAWIVSL